MTAMKHASKFQMHVQKIKLEESNNPHTSNEDVPHNQWLYHELGKCNSREKTKEPL